MTVLGNIGCKVTLFFRYMQIFFRFFPFSTLFVGFLIYENNRTGNTQKTGHA